MYTTSPADFAAAAAPSRIPTPIQKRVQFAAMTKADPTAHLPSFGQVLCEPSRPIVTITPPPPSPTSTSSSSASSSSIPRLAVLPSLEQIRSRLALAQPASPPPSPSSAARTSRLPLFLTGRAHEEPAMPAGRAEGRAMISRLKRRQRYSAPPALQNPVVPFA